MLTSATRGEMLTPNTKECNSILMSVTEGFSSSPVYRNSSGAFLYLAASHLYIYCGSHDGGQRNAHQPIFPYNVIENSLTSLACNFVFIGQNNFKFSAK